MGMLIHVAKKWLEDLKEQACELGRFPSHRRDALSFDNRYTLSIKEQWKPFRSIAYNTLIRRINCLETFILHHEEKGKEA